jgi:poly-beta-hydroxyalkanoate depolymerase
MKEMLEIDHDAGNVPITAGTFTLPLEDVLVHVKMVFMNHPDLHALHVLSPAINALAVRLLAQIALKTADYLSCILKHA